MKKTTLFAIVSLIIGVSAALSIFHDSGLPQFSTVTIKNLEALTKSEEPQLDCNYEIIPQDNCIISADLKAKAEALGFLPVKGEVEGYLEISGMRECKLNKEVAMTCEPYRCSVIRSMLYNN